MSSLPSRLAPLALLALTSACTSYELAVRDPAPPGALDAGPPGLARVCVIRPLAVAQLVPAVVRDNGKLVGMTKGPSYFCYLAEPGQHRIVSTYGDDIDAKLGTGDVAEATLTAAPGGSYFLEHDVRKIVSLSSRWVTPELASSMIADCDYVELVAVPGDEALPPRGAVARAAAPARAY
jgi:hypothetical protein